MYYKIQMYNKHSTSVNKSKYFKDHDNTSYRRIKQKSSKATLDNLLSSKNISQQLIHNGQVLKMRQQMEQLNKNISLNHLEPIQDQFVTFDSKHLIKTQIATISPIYTKNKLDYNSKIEILSKRLAEITQNVYFSPEKIPNRMSRNSQHNKSKHLDRHNDKSMFEFSQDTLSYEFKRYEDVDQNKKQSKSTYLVSQQSTSRMKLNTFLESRVDHKIFPTSRQAKAVSSIQEYMLYDKLNKKQQLRLQILHQYQPHRHRITSLVSDHFNQLYSCSLDYTVAKHSYENNGIQVLNKHRAGVECMLLAGDHVITGGRDCYLRSTDSWSRRFDNQITSLTQINSSRLLVKSHNLFEFDMQTLSKVSVCKTDFKAIVMNKTSAGAHYIGISNLLFAYDARVKALQNIMTVPDHIKYWTQVKDCVIAIGQYIWVGNNTNSLNRTVKCPDTSINAVADYYSSFILSTKQEGLLLFDLKLNCLVPIQGDGDQVHALSNMKNKVGCGMADGRIRVCIIK